MILKKSILWAGLIIIVLVVSGFFLNSGSSTKSGINGAVIKTDIGATSSDIQVVKMYVKGPQYIFEPSSVKKGVPVRLEADILRMPGCSKSIISSELGIRKTFNSGDNTLEFTPNKAGTFYFACSMNMYTGTLTVLESDGSKSNYIQTPASTGGSCGAGGGGCGCGA